jgi:hypothetical protein
MVASRLVRFLPYADGLPDPGPGLFKLSVVILLSAVLALASASWGALPRILTILASETLIIYVVHVALVYGAGYGLGDLIGPTAGVGASMGIALGMVVFSALVGIGWHWIKGLWSRRRGGPAALARGVKAG